MLQFELTILNNIQAWFQCEAMDWLMPKISVINDGGLIWIILIICLLITKRYRKVGILCAVGLIIGVIIGNGILKNWVTRPRPCWIKEVSLLVSMPDDFSFPSGHTLSSFIMITILMLADKKIGIPALIVGLSIAFSRLYLYVHFPTDVLGGMLLGTAIGLTVWFVYKRTLEKKFGPAVNIEKRTNKEM